MLTGISVLKCASCKSTIVSAATGSTHPYNDYECDQCGWAGTICEDCGSEVCQKCGGQLKSTHKALSESFGGPVMF